MEEAREEFLINPSIIPLSIRDIEIEIIDDVKKFLTDDERLVFH